MGAKKFSHTHRSTMHGLKKLGQGFSGKVEKCWQNGDGAGRDGGGGGNGPKTQSAPVTRVT